MQQDSTTHKSIIGQRHINMNKKFEAWVRSNYTGKIMQSFPDDWNREKEFFYLIDGLQYRIQIKDVPQEFI